MIEVKEATLDTFTRTTQALSDPARVRAMISLQHGELCLCQLIEILDLAPSTISRHMKILHETGLITRRRAGKWQYFRLARESDDPFVRSTLNWLDRNLKDDPAAHAHRERTAQVAAMDPQTLCDCYAPGTKCC